MHIGLKLSTFEKLVREGALPKPRLVSDRRVVWLRTELETWLSQRPVSDQMPPPNTTASKPRQNSRIAHQD